MKPEPVENQPTRGDFFALLQQVGHPITRPAAAEGSTPVSEVHGTTVIAVKYDGGVLNVGDRRATGGTAVMYDKAEKILALDEHTLLAVSGSYATALNIARYLQHSFKYYRRTQLQVMSLEGKLQEIGRMIANNLPNVLSGIGAFLPVLSTWDTSAGEGRIYFYDGMGARFEQAEHGAAGSGSAPIRGVFEYVTRTKGPFHAMPLKDALRECLQMLDIAADLDSATGGYDKILPSAMTVGSEGVRPVDDTILTAAIQDIRSER